MKKGISALLLFLSGMGTGGLLAMNEENKIVCRKEESLVKFWMMYHMMEKWMRLKLKGGTLGEYLQKAGYKNIAIYGMGDVGQLLLSELSGSDVHVMYGIDKNTNIEAEIPVYQMSPELEPVDAVVVTAIAYYDEIAAKLREILDCPVLSMENIVATQCYKFILQPPERVQ